MGIEQPAKIPVPSEGKSRKSCIRVVFAGCCMLAGCGIILLAIVFCEMEWGGDSGNHFYFNCRFNFNTTGSNADIVIWPMEKPVQHLAIEVLAGGAIFGFGVLLAKRRFSLATLMIVVLIVGGIPIIPFYFLRFISPNAEANIAAKFPDGFKLRQLKDLAERLDAFSIAAWQPPKSKFAFPSPSLAELNMAHYKVQTFEDLGAMKENFIMVGFCFREEISFERQKEICEFYLEFFETQMSAVAHEMGFAPIRPEDRHVRERHVRKE